MLEFAKGKEEIPRKVMDQAPGWRNFLIGKRVDALKERLAEEGIKTVDIERDEKAKGFISLLQNYLGREFKRFEKFQFEGTEEINRERIFIFDNIPENLWEEIINGEQPGARTLGAFSDLGFIAINWEKIKNGEADENKFKLFCSLAHEIIHSKSYQKYIVSDSGKTEQDKKMYSAENCRSGFQRMRKTGEEQKIGFLFLNEAITERITRDFLNENKKIISETFKISEREVDDYVYGKNKNSCYDDELKLLHEIIKRISQETKTDYADVLDDFKKGYFNGKTNFLKVFNKIWGPGSVKMLSQIVAEKEKGDKSAERFF